jgi:hypothetical protein
MYERFRVSSGVTLGVEVGGRFLTFLSFFSIFYFNIQILYDDVLDSWRLS